ncbi:MAG: glycosyl hydrolase family 18 protein, partial [Polaribacter sp.]
MIIRNTNILISSVACTCFMMLFFNCSKEVKTNNNNVKDLKIIGYVAGYENYDHALIAAEKLTHINYAFANIVEGKPKFELDTDSLKISKLIALKKVNPNLKVLYSVGGLSLIHISQ